MKLTKSEKYFLLKLHHKIKQAQPFIMQGFNFDLEAFLIVIEIEEKTQNAKQSIESLTKKGCVKILKNRIEITTKGYEIIQKIIKSR